VTGKRGGSAKGRKSQSPPATGIAQRRAERREAGWRRSDQRWEEIVAGAANVFNRLGYAQTSLEDVAQEVGINRASLYYYVGTKAELLTSVLTRPVEKITSDLKAIDALDLSPREKLERAIAKHMQNLADNFPHLFVFLAENLHLMPGTRGIDREASEYGRVLTSIIAAGMDSGEFRTDLDPHIAMLGIVGMCNWTHRWYSPRGEYALPEIGEQFSRLVVDGLSKPPRQARITAPAARTRARQKPIPTRTGARGRNRERA
jgi:AcrR family transcriptional regulator